MLERVIIASSDPEGAKLINGRSDTWRVATKYRERIFEGTIHPLIFDLAIRSEFPEAQFTDCEEGFIAPDGRFLNRKEAKVLADALDLIGPIRPGERSDELWSEQLPLHVLVETK